MSPVLRWGVIVGSAIVLIDLATLLLQQGPLSGQADLLTYLDLFANVFLLAALGDRVAREAGSPRSAAEAGVLAGTIAGLAAVAAAAAFGVPGATEESAIVGTLAWNVAQGGLLALLAGWLAARRPAPRS